MTSSPKSPGHAVGEFPSQDEAERVRTVLQTAGFAPEQISLDVQTIDPKPPIQQTQAVSSTAGATLIGLVLGGGIGFIVSLGVLLLPENGPNVADPGIFSFLAVGGGALVGAGGFSIIGALAGGYIPKSATATSENPAHQYLLEVRGSESELLQAKAIMGEQGARV